MYCFTPICQLSQYVTIEKNRDVRFWAIKLLPLFGLSTMPLPVSAEIDRRLAASSPDPATLIYLIAIRHAAVVFAPCCFLGVTEEILRPRYGDGGQSRRGASG